VKEKENRIRQRTVTNFNNRHRTLQLPSLPKESMVYVRDMHKEGSVISKPAPRSYEVETSTGTVRRNRRALVQVRGTGGDTEAQLPRDPWPVTQEDAEVPNSSLTTASPKGVRASASNVAEGTGLPTSQSASRLMSDMGVAHRREHRASRLPKYLTDNYELY